MLNTNFTFFLQDEEKMKQIEIDFVQLYKNLNKKSYFYWKLKLLIPNEIESKHEM